MASSQRVRGTSWFLFCLQNYMKTEGNTRAITDGYDECVGVKLKGFFIHSIRRILHYIDFQ